MAERGMVTRLNGDGRTSGASPAAHSKIGMTLVPKQPFNKASISCAKGGRVHAHVGRRSCA